MKLLVFQHVPHETPGLIQDYADKRGIQLDIVEFWRSYKIPPLANYSGLILMGGPMGVYEGKDVFPSKDDEVKVIQEAVGEGFPIIGFCLGSQLLAHALGAKVYPNRINGKTIKEIGYYDIELTPQGKSDPLFQGFPSPFKALQWHGDAFDLPQDASLLATTPYCKNQAFRYSKNAYGMLFHNEFTPDMIDKQIDVDSKWIHENFELDEAELKQQADKNRTLMQKQCNRLFDNFLALSAK